MFRTDLNAAATELSNCRTALAKHFEAVDKENIAGLSDTARTAQSKLFENECQLIKAQIAANNTQIEEYKQQRTQLQTSSTSESSNVVVKFQDSYADKAGIPRATPAPPPNAAANGKDDSDFWTSISLEVSSSYSHEETETQATSWSVGGSASWGLWSVGVSASHSDSHSNASKQMANSSVKVSFECMRVDITRPWLRGELFYDHDLRVAAGEL